MTENKLDHLSPSTVQSYRTCGKQVYFSKVLCVDNPVKYAMTSYGSAMHRAIERLYKEHLDQDKYCAAFTEEWETLSKEVTMWKTDSCEYLLGEGLKACDDFYKDIYGKYDIELVEQQFDIKRDDGLPILCFADAITKDGIIIDYKFGRGLSGTADSKSYACNMATYAWAYEEKYGKSPSKIVFIKQKWSKKRDKETGKYIFSHAGFIIDEQDVKESVINFYKNVYSNVEIGIKAGVWLPASDESYLCKTCGYRIIGLCDREA